MVTLYRTDVSGNEIYPIRNNNTYYLKNENGDEIYAHASNQDMFYRMENGNTVYAKKANGDEYFARNKFLQIVQPTFQARDEVRYPVKHDGTFVFPTTKHSIQYYLTDSQGLPIYPVIKGIREVYAKNKHGEEIVIELSKNEFLYAKKWLNGEELQYYPQNSEKDMVAKTSLLEYIYAFNLTTGDPIYPRIKGGDEYYSGWTKRDQSYLHNQNTGIPKYAIDANGNAIFAVKRYIPFYASDLQNIRQYYPQMKNGCEFYLKLDEKEIYAMANGETYYAINEFKKEILAKINGKEYYRQNLSNQEIYPRTQNLCEYYKIEGDREICALLDGIHVYFAKNQWNNEIYPKKELLF